MKNKSIKNTFYNSSKNEINIIDAIDNYSLINDKIIFIQEIIRNTILSIQNYKMLNIFSNNDIDICNTTLTELYSKTCSLIEENKQNSNNKTKNCDPINIGIQNLIEKLTIIISGFGTKNIEDVLFLVFGNKNLQSKIENKIFENKFSLIKNNLHPIGFKIIPWKSTKINQIQEKNIIYCQNKWNDDNKNIHYYNNFECFDIDYNEKSFYYKIYGIQTIIKNEKLRKTIIINCITDDILLEYFSNLYIDNRRINILENIPKNELYDIDIMKRLIDSLSLKDILIYGNDDIYKNYISIINDVKLLKTNKIDLSIKNFLELDILFQRKYLINILIYNKDPDIYYIAYLLYDLLTVHNNDNNESIHHRILYDSFPYKIKQYLKDTMNITMKYTQEMISNYDNNKNSLEQQVYLFKAPDNVKEKAIAKLKEVKSKSDDTASKTRQYLEGLLKIPFNIYKKEPILKINKTNNQKFISILNNHKEVFHSLFLNPDNIVSESVCRRSGVADGTETLNSQICREDAAGIERVCRQSGVEDGTETRNSGVKDERVCQPLLLTKDCYTKIEINKTIEKMDKLFFEYFFKDIIQKINKTNNKNIIQIIHFFQSIEKSLIEFLPFHIHENFYSSLDELLKQTTKNKRILLLRVFIDLIYNNINYNNEIMIQLCKIYDFFDNINISFSKIPLEIKEIKNNNKEIKSYLNNVTNILDESIFGHSYAKNQILKIVSQWMTGEHNGYCFGFEGSPGIGKTSLAKNGLSKCLVDENGVTRPFSFIALGGSCNGSTLEGHSFTYVNSSWGRIVDILMDTKCMNPIIYIDELDKVSKTEHGREIIGILTHLIDSTQNDIFQDKYFSGVELDLSKVLFIFSYNDPEQIDKVLLDRIHRIKFDNITLNEKIVIVEKYILPEINRKMGFSNTVIISKDIIEYIIEKYTMEPGVRKLKEVLFDLYGEINIQILKDDENNIQIPLIIKIEDIDKIYLKKYKKIEDKKIHTENKIGIINGLWANSFGKGGIISIEAVFFPSNTFLDFKLTGLQGDVMKESMNVAKSLAWNLCDENVKKELIQTFETTKCQGIHIHCPEGAVSKDGPSAGSAITIAIYSLLNKKKIKKDIAITGEINLQGDVTAIGGLDLKIIGGIRSGIKTFLYPKENQTDFDNFMSKQESILEVESNTEPLLQTLASATPPLLQTLASLTSEFRGSVPSATPPLLQTHNKKPSIYDSITFISVQSIQDIIKHVFVDEVESQT